MNPRRFVLLDRDGTLNVERRYLADSDGLELLPNAATGLRRLRDLGLGLAVITNQSGVGRGFFDLARLEAIHGRLADLLLQNGVVLDGIFACPHTPEDECECRKPRPGLVWKAVRELGFDPEQAFFVGDQVCDVELGQRLGGTTFLVRTGYGAQESRDGRAWPDFVVADLAEAAGIIGRIVDRGEADSLGAGRLTADAGPRLRRHLLGSIAAKQRLLDECQDDILSAAELIATSLAQGGKLLLCGNGGSAADCQHIAGEFVNVLTKRFARPALPAIALTTDTSVLTAQANDFGFASVFERQVEALGRPGDALAGLSTSGDSENVVRAIQAASKLGLSTLALTGGPGGSLADLAQVAVRVPSLGVQHIQEAHITVGHVLCELAERALFGQGQPVIADGGAQSYDEPHRSLPSLRLSDTCGGENR